MTLGERIREQRRRSGLSQEKVAQLVGVSRQAVTKWESGQSSPSTDNLLKLSELFGVSLDRLISDESDEAETASAEERAYALFWSMQAGQAAQRQRLRRRSCIAALGIAAGYLLFYFTGLLLWSDGSETTALGWLDMASPKGEHDYLFGWLYQNHLMWYAMALSVLTALWGKRRFAAVTLGGFFVGFLAGVLFGPNPAGAAYGQSHYGWVIWGLIFLISILAGALIQHFWGRT